MIRDVTLKIYASIQMAALSTPTLCSLGAITIFTAQGYCWVVVPSSLMSAKEPKSVQNRSNRLMTEPCRPAKDHACTTLEWLWLLLTL